MHNKIRLSLRLRLPKTRQAAILSTSDPRSTRVLTARLEHNARRPRPPHHDGVTVVLPSPCEDARPDSFTVSRGFWEAKVDGCLANLARTAHLFQVESRSPQRNPHGRFGPHGDGTGVFLDCGLRLGRPQEAANPKRFHIWTKTRPHNKRRPSRQEQQ